MLFLVIIFILFLYIAIIYFYNLWKYRRYNGPIPLPIIGNLYNFKNFSFIGLINKLSKKYGEVFRFFIFNKPFIVITNPELIRYILTNSDTFYKDDSFYKNGLGIIFGQGLVTSNNKKHKEDKHIFHKYFINSNINNHKQIIIDIAKKEINNLKDFNMDFNIEHFFAKITLKSILKYGFNVDTELLNSKDKELELCNIISNCSYLFAICSILNIPHWNLIPIINKLKYYRSYGKKDLIKIIEYHKNNSDNIDNILSMMLNNKMTLDEMTDHYNTILSAGQDTTSYLMSYMAYLLAHNQDIQDKIREEFNNQQNDDYTNFPYFNMVIKETLRLYTVVPQVTRTCNEDVCINKNIIIPKNSTIIIPFYIPNRDPNIWENPNEFNPDRFKDKHNLIKLGYLPFCYGSRTCIGKDLANIETTIVMCNLLKNYKILPVIGFKPDIIAGISLTTKNGIKVKLEKIL